MSGSRLDLSTRKTGVGCVRSASKARRALTSMRASRIFQIRNRIRSTAIEKQRTSCACARREPALDELHHEIAVAHFWVRIH